ILSLRLLQCLLLIGQQHLQCVSLLRALTAHLFLAIAPAPTEIFTLSLHDALPISIPPSRDSRRSRTRSASGTPSTPTTSRRSTRSEEHTSELQSRGHLVCRLLLEKKEIVRRGDPLLADAGNRRCEGGKL